MLSAIESSVNDIGNDQNEGNGRPLDEESIRKYLSFDQKQSVLKWSGTFEDSQSFCEGNLLIHLSESLALSNCKRSHSIKLKTATLTLYKNTGTLQLQGADSKTLKAKIQSLIPSTEKTASHLRSCRPSRE